MNSTKTTPLSAEDIGRIDKITAPHLLLVDLCQIPEFIELWSGAQAELDRLQIIEVIRSALSECFAAMSPEGRGALAASEGDLWRLYGDEAIKEMNAAQSYLADFHGAVSETLKRLNIKHRRSGSYKIRIEAQKDVKRFFKTIGSHNPKHLKKYASVI